MAFVKPYAQKNSNLISIEATIKIDLGKTSKQVRNATAKALETGIVPSRQGKTAELFELLYGNKKPRPYATVSTASYDKILFIPRELMTMGERKELFDQYKATDLMLKPKDYRSYYQGCYEGTWTDYHYIRANGKYWTRDMFLNLIPDNVKAQMGDTTWVEALMEGKTLVIKENY